MEPVRLCDWKRGNKPLSLNHRTAKLEGQMSFVKDVLVPGALSRPLPEPRQEVFVIHEFDSLHEKLPVYRIERDNNRFTMYSNLVHWIISAELVQPSRHEFHFALPVLPSSETCPHMPDGCIHDCYRPGMSTFTIVFKDRWDVYTFFRMLGLNRKVQS